jgi:hypothetical protein
VVDSATRLFLQTYRAKPSKTGLTFSRSCPRTCMSHCRARCAEAEEAVAAGKTGGDVALVGQVAGIDLKPPRAVRSGSSRRTACNQACEGWRYRPRTRRYSARRRRL